MSKKEIEIYGTFTGKIKYGICKCFEWKEYKYKNKYYNVSQFSNEFELIGGYSDITGNYTKKLKDY